MQVTFMRMRPFHGSPSATALYEPSPACSVESEEKTPTLVPSVAIAQSISRENSLLVVTSELG